jgi:hypothetical protein
MLCKGSISPQLVVRQALAATLTTLTTSAQWQIWICTSDKMSGDFQHSALRRRFTSSKIRVAQVAQAQWSLKLAHDS